MPIVKQFRTANRHVSQMADTAPAARMCALLAATFALTIFLLSTNQRCVARRPHHKTGGAALVDARAE